MPVFKSVFWFYNKFGKSRPLPRLRCLKVYNRHGVLSIASSRFQLLLICLRHLICANTGSRHGISPSRSSVLGDALTSPKFVQVCPTRNSPVVR